MYDNKKSTTITAQPRLCPVHWPIYIVSALDDGDEVNMDGWMNGLLDFGPHMPPNQSQKAASQISSWAKELHDELLYFLLLLIIISQAFSQISCTSSKNIWSETISIV